MTQNGKIKGAFPGTRMLRWPDSEQRYAITNGFREAVRRRGYEPVELPLFYRVGTFVGKVIPRKYGQEVGQVITRFDSEFRCAELAYELTAAVAEMMAITSSTQGRFAYAPGRIIRLEDPSKIEAEPDFRLIDFYQLGIENFTVPQIMGNVETASVFLDFADMRGLEAVVRVSSVELLRRMLGDQQLDQPIQIAIKNMLDKNEIGALTDYLVQRGVNGDFKSQLVAMSQINGDLDRCIAEIERIFPRYNEVVGDLKQFSELAKVEGIYPRIRFDQKAQRGLLFYRKMGMQGDIGDELEVMGGGDYAVNVNGTEIIGSGFGIGLERLELVMQRAGKLPEVSQRGGYLVAGTDAPSVLRRANELRKNGVVVETYIGERAQAQEYATQKSLALTEASK